MSWCLSSWRDSEQSMMWESGFGTSINVWWSFSLQQSSQQVFCASCSRWNRNNSLSNQSVPLSLMIPMGMLGCGWSSSSHAFRIVSGICDGAMQHQQPLTDMLRRPRAWGDRIGGRWPVAQELLLMGPPSICWTCLDDTMGVNSDHQCWPGNLRCWRARTFTLSFFEPFQIMLFGTHCVCSTRLVDNHGSVIWTLVMMT